MFKKFKFSPKLVTVSLLFLFTIALSASAQAQLYVDTSISSSSCTTYNTSTRSCSGGTSKAYKTLAGAESAATAGTTILVRAATFGSQWQPAKSGAAGQPITWRAYPGETVSFTYASDAAIYFLNRSYVVLDRFVFNNPGGFMRIENSNYITVQNSTFTAGSHAIQGRTGSLRLINSKYNKIINNKFTTDLAFDNIYAASSDRNLIAGNQFLKGAQHTVLTITCGNYNIIRNNIFYNDRQKIGETFDCASPETLKQNATHRNFWENNEFRQTAANSAKYNSNGIQFCGEENVVRQNIFYNNLGGGVSFQSYSDECTYDMNNRVYNNTFYKNRCFGVNSVGSKDATFTGNILKNNLLYQNTNCSGGGTAQVEFDDASATNCNGTYSCSNGANMITATDPKFVNGSTLPYDLHLQSTSPAIGKGTWLTTTSGSGSASKTLVVADARYFRDGLGIAGEVGDVIQLQGQTQKARIVALNYSTRTLTLDTALTWASGVGVALAYTGSAPNAGAFENGSTSSPTPTNQAPLAKLTVTPTSGAAPLAVTASTSGSSDPDGTIASTSINFGDGTVLNAASGSHTYSTAGTYTVTAKVTDNAGASSSATATVTVTSSTSTNKPPVATLTVTPTSGTAPVTVTASTSGSSDPDGTIVSTSINFGDGTVLNAASGSHTYSSAGTYTVTATVKDNSGATSSATATVTVTTASQPSPSGSQPPAGLLGTQMFALPVGTPMPAFGVSNKAPAYPSPWDGSNMTSGGYQFYYVCPGCSGSTDSSNTYGYPGKGRSTLPSTVTGPAVVVLGTAGQTINLNLSNTTWAGSASGPIFVRSFDTSNPVWITAPQASLAGGNKYTIFEYLRFKPASSSTTDWGMYLQEGVDHVTIRYSEFAGSTSSNSSGFGIGTWSYSGSQVVDNVVLLSTYIHDQYDVNASGDPDDHCVTLNGRIQNTWIMYNEMARCAGDGIQIEAQHGNMASINHIYVGKNYAHGNRQSGFWVKHATDVIISQNKADNHWGNSANGDPGICYGSQYSPVRAWFVGNECSRANIALAVSSDDGDPGSSEYFVANWTHDLNAVSTGVYDSGGIRCESQANVYFVNNLFYQLNRNLNFLPGCGAVTFDSNIMSRASGDTSHYDVYTEGGTTMKFNNNIFSASPRFTNGSTTTTSCSGLSNLGTNSGCSTTQPTFVNPTGLNFHLASGSAGIDAVSGTDSVYTTFQTLYGRSIQFDAGGTARPRGTGWDIGPYEF